MIDFESNMKLVYGYLNRYHPALIKNEDIVQELYLTLWKCCLKYDESKGVTFATYAYRSFSACLAEYWRKKHAAKREGGLFLVSLDSFFKRDEDSFFKESLDKQITQDDLYGRRTEEALIAKETVNDIYEKLDEDEIRFLNLMLAHDFKQKDLAEIYGVTRSYISRRWKDIREHCKRIAEGE